MEKFMDKAEYFAARRLHVIYVAVLVIVMIASIVCIFTEKEQGHPVTDGAWHCPNCGTVMYLESKEV